MAGRCFSVLALAGCVAVWGVWLNYIVTALEGDCGQNNRYITFLTPVSGFYLEGHVFLNLSVKLNLDCQDQCALARECVSYNIGATVDNKMACELSNSDHLQHPEDLKPRHDWIYRGTKNLCATKPCLNNGTCYLGYTEKKFVCFCPTGFSGENCEKVASCSYLKKSDPTARSGNYVIDPDGEGGLEPFTVYCDMTEKNRVGVTVIIHDSESRTQVKGYEDPGSYSRDIHYIGSSLSQLASLTRVSSHCEQFIKYECYHSVLLYNNNSDGWWVSRDSTKMTYWCGASVSGKCACGMNNSCPDSRYGCYCDANDLEWREDSGFLTDKTKLPVKQLRFGDTGDEKYSEEGYHTLGKFKCYGKA